MRFNEALSKLWKITHQKSLTFHNLLLSVIIAVATEVDDDFRPLFDSFRLCNFIRSSSGKQKSKQNYTLRPLWTFFYAFPPYNDRIWTFTSGYGVPIFMSANIGGRYFVFGAAREAELRSVWCMQWMSRILCLIFNQQLRDINRYDTWIGSR